MLDKTCPDIDQRAGRGQVFFGEIRAFAARRRRASRSEHFVLDRSGYDALPCPSRSIGQSWRRLLDGLGATVPPASLGTPLLLVQIFLQRLRVYRSNYVRLGGNSFQTIEELRKIIHVRGHSRSFFCLYSAERCPVPVELLRPAAAPRCVRK